MTSIDISLETGADAIRLSSLDGAQRKVSDDYSGPQRIDTTPATDLGSASPPTASAVNSHRDSASIGRATSRTESEQSRQASATSLPPVDRGRAAWTFMIAAMVLEMLVFGMGNASGTFQDYHMSSPQSPLYGTSSTVSAASSTLVTAGQYFAPFLFSGYLNAFPHHVSRFTGTALLTSIVALIFASIWPSPATVIALQGLVAGWAAGAFYTPAMLWLPQWFDKKRGLATGILFLGTGVGGVIWPFIISGLLTNVGFAWTLRVLALMQGVLGVGIFYFLRPRIRPQRPAAWTSRRNLLRAILPPHDKMIQSPLGIANGLLQFFHSAAYWSIRVYLSPFATSLGFSRTISTALLSEFNAATAFSYLLTGRLVDTFPYAPLMMILGSIGSLLLAVGLGFAKSLPSLFIFAMLYGLTNGGFSCFMTPAAREMATLGQTEQSNIFVEILFFRGMGGIAGPLISSVLYGGNTGATTKPSSPWTDTAIYGSHGIGSIVIFTSVCTLLVPIAASAIIPVRKRWEARRAPTTQ